MKKLSLLAIGMALLRATATAAPCTTGTLASYIALGTGGCTLGNLQVAGFAYQAKAGGGAPEITADQITVAPLLAPTGTFGLQFSAPWSVQADQSQASEITYRALAPATALPVQQVRLDGNDFHAGTFARVVVDESVATPATTSSLQAYLKCTEVCHSQTSAALTFASGAPLLVVHDRVTLQARLGPASAGGFTDWLVVCLPCV